MAPSDELTRVKERLARLARELDETRQAVVALEARLQPAALAASPPAGPPPAMDETTATSAITTPSVAPEPVTMGTTPSEPPPLPAVERVAPPVVRPEPLPSAWPQDDAGRTNAPSPLRQMLERLQLWPPQDEANAEVRLGAWWATRLGTLFAVIGVVFFGVYLSVGTPPWVKLTELAVVALGVTVFGWWMERRTPRFGQVVFAGGQALIFFTALAAYSVPAVKVLESRSAAVVWQLLAAAWIGVSAWRRRAPVEATVAVILGFVAAGFSLAGGLQVFAAASSLALAATAVLWCRGLGWTAPSIVALLGFWSVFATIVGGFSLATTPLLPDWIWILVAGGYALFFWRDDPAGHRSPPRPRETVWFQNTGSSAAVAAGWFTAWTGFPESLETFYLAAAGVLGLAAWRRRVVAGAGDVVGAVLIAKCSGAVTLAVISWTDGRTTEIALLVQAWVMLAANRHVRSRTLEAAAAVVWFASLGYYLEWLQGAPREQWSLGAAMAALYLAGAVAWLLEVARAVRSSRPGLADGSSMLAALVGAPLVVATALQLLPLAWLPTRLMVGAAVLVGVAAIWRQRAPAIAGGVVLGLAHAGYWVQFEGIERAVGVVNAVILLLPTLIATVWLGRRLDRVVREPPARQVAGSWLTGAAAILTGVVATTRLVNLESAVAFALVVAGALTWASPLRPRRRWLWLATGALVVGLVTFLRTDLSRHAGYGIGGALLIWLGLAAFARSVRGAAQLAYESARPWPQRIIVAVGLVWGTWAIEKALALEAGLLVTSGFALLALVLFNVAWVGAYRGAAWLLWVYVLVALASPSAWDAPWVAGAVLPAWIPVLIWGGLPALLQPGRERGFRVDATLTVQAWLAAALAVTGIAATQVGAALTCSLLALTGGVAVLARWRIRPLVDIARTLLAVTAGFALWALLDGDRTWDENAWAAAGTAVAAGVLPFVLPWSKAARPAGTWIAASAGLALFFAVSGRQGGAVEPFVTVLWGGAGLLWFAFGLIGRSQPHRLLGLLALLCCIPRVFLVDLQSTLHRILAFAALGLVLLWVGFSYHRFRRWITEDPGSGSTEGKG